METTAIDFLAIARREIEAGIPVIPVRAGQKQPPLMNGGTTSASIDLETAGGICSDRPSASG